MNINFGGMRQQAADLSNKVTDKAKDFGEGVKYIPRAKVMKLKN